MLYLFVGRIIISGSYFNKTVIPESARAYKFDKVYDLNEAEALDVSDHYPVEVALKIGNDVSSSHKVAKSISQVMAFYFFTPAILAALSDILRII